MALTQQTLEETWDQKASNYEVKVVRWYKSFRKEWREFKFLTREQALETAKEWLANILTDEVTIRTVKIVDDQLRFFAKTFHSPFPIAQKLECLRNYLGCELSKDLRKGWSVGGGDNLAWLELQQRNWHLTEKQKAMKRSDLIEMLINRSDTMKLKSAWKTEYYVNDVLVRNGLAGLDYSEHHRYFE